MNDKILLHENFVIRSILYKHCHTGRIFAVTENVEGARSEDCRAQ